MKRGWLIYDCEGAKRNKWFIEECLRLAEEYGLSLSLKIVGEGWGKCPDFALVRTINPALSQDLDRAGVRLFNNVRVAEMANDKWASHVAAQCLGIKTMPTCLMETALSGSPFGYPVVVKSRDGHGGAEVFLMGNADEYKQFCRAHAVENYIVQKLCSEVGKDLRIYLLGGKILAGVLRSSSVDFRSNYSLGGKVEQIPAPAEIEKTVQILEDEYAFDFVGVDFIYDGEGWVLNEIEDVVGSRMLYQVSGLDVARLYISHVAQALKD